MPRDIKKTIPFTLVINDNRRSVKTASILEGVVNQRFHFADGVNEAGAAKGKTDQWLELKVPASTIITRIATSGWSGCCRSSTAPRLAPSGWRRGGRSYSTPNRRSGRTEARRAGDHGRRGAEEGAGESQCAGPLFRG